MTDSGRSEGDSYQFTTVEAVSEPPFAWEDRAVLLEIVVVIAGVDVRAAFGDRIAGDDL